MRTRMDLLREDYRSQRREVSAVGSENVHQQSLPGCMSRGMRCVRKTRLRQQYPVHRFGYSPTQGMPKIQHQLSEGFSDATLVTSEAPIGTEEQCYGL
ncbi:hypothetical protein Pcinc_017792 [Petrolisthes cinctipes]|uniref:Uncharacterized protein n=1 Tax=Petrolisthes cinctipes TaxID=88211 RepID=A0AAE1KPH5_PETCI|nr:hypothetical protein Pcinc_017792 [Petrolisthes cinctipes]